MPQVLNRLSEVNFSGVPFKYERIEEPSDKKPGLIRVHNIETLSDGSKREFYEDYNTVSLLF